MGTGDMKYFDEMTAIENEIIRLDTLKSLVTVVTNGLETTAKPEDIENTMWHILGSLEDIVEKQYETFQTLFDTLVENDVDGVLTTNEYVDPTPESKELEKVMQAWIRNP